MEPLPQPPTQVPAKQEHQTLLTLADRIGALNIEPTIATKRSPPNDRQPDSPARESIAG